ncbi:MAG TPA: HEPN domain-containing protein [Limnochordales bacterium]
MTSQTLGEAYLWKAQRRLRVLDVLMEEQAYSDVVREAQEVVELALKAVLQYMGVDPPKWHDVGPVMLQLRERLPQSLQPDVERMAAISRWLRKEREFSFDGDVDFIPTEQYTREDAARALSDARFVVERVSAALSPPSGSSPAPS